MKDINQLHDEVRRKYREEGVLDLAKMLELQEERKTENSYAARLGFKQPLGLDGSSGINPENTVIGFFVGRDVLFLGDQALRVKDLIEGYATRLRLSLENMEGSDRQILARVDSNRLKIVKVNGDTDQLTLWGNQWNDWLTAIYKTGTAFMVFSIEEGC